MNRLRFCAAAVAALVMVALTPTGVGATFPGVNGRIIFSRASFATAVNLFSMEPDGSNETRLTSRRRQDFGASWDPDGSRFIYSHDNFDGTFDLFIRDADGSNPTRVTNSVRDEFDVAFGPDGNQAVYASCRAQCDLFKIDLTSGTQTRLTDTRVGEFGPHWSVDDVILFERAPRNRGDIEIFTISSDGTNPTRLTDNRRIHDIQAAWSPDGTRIVYSRCVRGFNGCDLVSMNAAGSGRDRITRTRIDESYPKFSPDGRFIVVTRSRGRQDEIADLFRIRTDGTRLRRLTNTPNRFEFDADWQPVVP
jgi:Tol biopolymer transport system component